MAVRALYDEKIYYTPTGMLIPLVKGREYDGELGVYLALNAPKLVEVLPEAAVEAPAVPDVEPAADDGDGDAQGDAPPVAIVAEQGPEATDLAAGGSVITSTEVAPPAVEVAQVETVDFDPAEHNTAAVLAYVKDHPETRAAVRAAEQAGKQRTGVLAQLA